MILNYSTVIIDEHTPRANEKQSPKENIITIIDLKSR